jgi:hypothetical protein
MTEYLLNFANVFGCDLLIFRQFPAGDRKIGNIRCFWTHQDSELHMSNSLFLQNDPATSWMKNFDFPAVILQLGSQAASTAVESNQYQDWASAPSPAVDICIYTKSPEGLARYPQRLFGPQPSSLQVGIAVPKDPYISYIWSNLLWHYTHFGGQKKFTQMKFTKFTKHWCSERPAGMRTRPYILTWKKHTKTPNG